MDRRIQQMEIEGVLFRTGVDVGTDITAEELMSRYDALVLAMGSESPLDLKVPGRDLRNIHFAMEYLVQQNRIVAGDRVEDQILASGKNVLIVGGGDTGSDCVGTANRQEAASIRMIRRSGRPSNERPPSEPWPFYPEHKLQTTSSHEEGVDRRWSILIRSLEGDEHGRVVAVQGSEGRRTKEGFVGVPGTEFRWSVDLVLIAMGYRGPREMPLLEQLGEMGLRRGRYGHIDARFGNDPGSFRTNLAGVFACGDVRRGQSLVVWAIAEGRKCASRVHDYLLEAVSS